MGFYEHGGGTSSQRGSAMSMVLHLAALGGRLKHVDMYSVLKTNQEKGRENNIKRPITSTLSESLISLVIPQDSHQLSYPQPGSSRYSFCSV